MRLLATIALCCLAAAPAGAATLKHYGRASHYCDPRVSSGARMDCAKHTCAHRVWPPGTYVRVTAIKSGRSVVCLVNDYGPAKWTGNLIDLSPAAFLILAPLVVGIIHVELTPLTTD